MNIEESLTLYQKGREAWNAWAEQMLTQRNKLIKTGQWSVERITFNDLSGWIGTIAATQEWAAAANCDFSAQTFLD
ncbi:MAG: hypothetical protein M3Y60_02580, partial [Bacteroidota bacterium]|nr:hypothetical protein [Bacteroidota bacterium]